MREGLHYDLPEADYHAHDSLSASGAKKLLPPSCPAKFKASLGKEVHSDTFDFGKAVHRKVLGRGPEIVVVEAASWQGKAAREQRFAAWDEGEVPILVADLAVAEACANSVLSHPIAAALFAAPGEPEVSALWTDPATGVQRRARFDFLPEKVEGRRLIVPDLKTARSAEPREFGKAVAADYGYLQQAAWYVDAIKALGIDDDPAFLFVAVEKVDPYVVTVCQLDAEAMHIGQALNRRAIATYAECKTADHWPGYTEEIATVSLPGWFTYIAKEIAS